MPAASEVSIAPQSRIAELARCVTCGSHLAGELTCAGCGRTYELTNGILNTIGTLEGRNRVAEAFYDGPGWKRFRPWEQAFLICQGGVRRARMEILKHALERTATHTVALEVGIGNGENLALLPVDWSVFGVDLARGPLEQGQNLRARLRGHLARAEAERLPFEDATFDLCWSVGGFNYYRDHDAAMREMERVTKPGGRIIVADENPGLHRAGLGHLIGIPALDKWWLSKLGLDPEFAAMVIDFDLDVAALIKQFWPDAAWHKIWHGLGYCVVHDRPR